MKTFTLTFSHIVEGIRVPLMNGDKEVTYIVEADSKTATYNLESVKTFCSNHGVDCRIRRVM